MVSAAGFAPALPRFQAGHVAATPRAVALPIGLAPTLSPQTTGCFSIQLRKQNGLPGRSLGEGWWEALVILQFVVPNFVL
jgi:hypothetical protein